MDIWIDILKTLITAGFALLGVYLANRKAAALMDYRLSQLEKKVDKHNNMIERTYKLEEANQLQEAELKRHNERLKIIESKL